jgi:hypothetical protein
LDYPESQSSPLFLVCRPKQMFYCSEHHLTFSTWGKKQNETQCRPKRLKNHRALKTSPGNFHSWDIQSMKVDCFNEQR